MALVLSVARPVLVELTLAALRQAGAETCSLPELEALQVSVQRPDRPLDPHC